jgi:hypothetical protein
MTKFSILVNTCDKFEDCWNPFFKLFKIYWPDYNGKIYLNTEYKDYKYEDLPIIAAKVCEIKQDSSQISWSECFIRALNSIDNDVVLYLQEDYFLKDTVKAGIVEEYADLLKNNDIDCIQLTDQGTPGGTKSQYKDLLHANIQSRDLVSCQAALWKKDVLLSILRSSESGWQFEDFGSKRARKSGFKIFVVDNAIVQLDKYEIIPYIFTGVVQGRWYAPVVDLFKKHDIQMDFIKRGFLHDAPKHDLKSKIRYNLKRFMPLLKHRLGLTK